MASKEDVVSYFGEKFENGKILGVEEFSGSEITFLVRTDRKNFVLKLFPNAPLSEVDYEFDLLTHLKENSPIAGNVLRVHSKTTFKDKVPGLVYNYIEGNNLLSEDLIDDVVQKIANIIARMHDSLIDLNFGSKERLDPASLSFLDFDNLSDPSESRLYQVVSEDQKEVQWESFPRTIIHDDINLDNILVSERNLVFIDFTEAHNSYRVSDLATSILELFVVSLDFDYNKIFEFISAYSEHADQNLSVDEIRALPYLIGRRLLFIHDYYRKRAEKGGHFKNYQEKYASAIEKLSTEYDKLKKRIEDHSNML